MSPFSRDSKNTALAAYRDDFKLFDLIVTGIKGYRTTEEENGEVYPVTKGEYAD